MGKKKITIKLDPNSISQAIREIEAYKQELTRRCQQMVESLTREGAEIARLKVVEMGANYTGELVSSIEGYFSPSAGAGIIRAGAWYAVFVEYGTGVVGAQSPHPDPQGWSYDINGHGEDGWVYFNDRDQRWHRTSGFQSRPFMYETGKELERVCHRLVQEVFAH